MKTLGFHIFFWSLNDQRGNVGEPGKLLNLSGAPFPLWSKGTNIQIFLVHRLVVRVKWKDTLNKWQWLSFSSFQGLRLNLDLSVSLNQPRSTVTKVTSLSHREEHFGSRALVSDVTGTKLNLATYQLFDFSSDLNLGAPMPHWNGNDERNWCGCVHAMRQGVWNSLEALHTEQWLRWLHPTWNEVSSLCHSRAFLTVYLSWHPFGEWSLKCSFLLTFFKNRNLEKNDTIT